MRIGRAAAVHRTGLLRCSCTVPGGFDAAAVAAAAAAAAGTVPAVDSPVHHTSADAPVVVPGPGTPAAP